MTSEGLYVCRTDRTQADWLTLDLASGTAKDCRLPHTLLLTIDAWCLLLSLSTFLDFSKIYLFSFYAYGYFVCAYVCVLYVCLVLVEARKRS